MMANEKNLKVPTSKEARKNGRKGGIRSGEVRREKKLLKELLEEVLETPTKTGNFFAISNAGGVPMRITPTAIIDIISPYGASNINPTTNDGIAYDSWRAVYASLPDVPSQYNGVGLTVTEISDL